MTTVITITLAMAILAFAYIFYQIGYQHGEDAGYMDAVEDEMKGDSP
jgi:hypothetical protein